MHKLTNEIKDYIIHIIHISDRIGSVNPKVKWIIKPMQSVLEKINPNQYNYFYKPNQTNPNMHD